MRQQQATVMIVEDFDDTRSMIRHFLEGAGYQVLEAVNGREAVEIARRELPRLVLMDLNMPVLDGFSAILRFREDKRLRVLPVIAITAYDTPEFRAAASAVRCDGYLAKPIDFDKLTGLLDSLLTKNRRAKDSADRGTRADSLLTLLLSPLPPAA